MKPGQPGVPKQALLLSLLALFIPVLTSSVVPAWATEEGILVWLLGLIPAFLLSYYRGWRGASIALAGGMAAFSVAQALIAAAGAQVPPPSVMLGLVVVLLAVSLGSGWLSARFHDSLDRVERLALTDPATELPNRRHVTLHLQRAFAAAERGADLSVVLFDLDHFKRINDRFGHAVGDEVIRQFAGVLQATTRQMNLSGRFGGEEFLSVLDGVDLDGARVFAERVLSGFRGLGETWDGATASAGIAEYERGMASPDVLVAAADQALYRAKREGRDRVALMTRQGRSAQGVVQADDAGSSEDARGHGEVVLVVDDDAEVLRVMAKMLKRRGYAPLDTTDPRRAIAIARGLETPVDLVVADVVMPEMSGFRLVEVLTELQPTVRALYISGYSREDVDWSGVPGAVKTFLSKPVSMDRLCRTVRETLDAPLPPPGSDPGPDLVESVLRSREEVLESRVAAQSAKLDDAYRDALLRLAWAAEYRDNLTGQHAERVGRLSAMLAEEMGAGEGLIAIIEMAATLHDLGKIGIPDSLLRKPDALTDAEQEVMRDHCVIGAQLLSGSRQPLMQEAERIALTHHERWDGAGYPRGLAGDAIPLSGRITAVADVYDSLTQMRPYRGSTDPAAALREVLDGRGTQFDPEVVDALARLADAGRLDELDQLDLVGARTAPASVRPEPASAVD